MVIRCTHEVLKAMGMRSHSLTRVDPDGDDIYVTMFLAERHKCLVAMHAETRMAVAILDVRTAQVRHLGALLGTAFEDLLRAMVLPTDLIAVAPDTPIATTAGHAPLGHLKLIASDVSHHLTRQQAVVADQRALNLAMQEIAERPSAAAPSPRSQAIARWERQVMSD